MTRLVRAAWSQSIDELALGRIARDADRLMNVDAAGAHMVLGGVAAARGDASTTRKHYRAALRLDKAQAQRNYTIALALLEEHAEALDVAVELLQTHPDDLGMLDHAIVECVETAAFEAAALFSERRLRLEPEQGPRMGREIDFIVAALADGSFTEDGVRELLRGVGLIQLDSGIRRVGIQLTAYLDEEAFLYQRFVHATARETASLNERLAEYVAGKPALADDPGLKFVAGFKQTGSHASIP